MSSHRKTVIITGANRGLGKAAAKEIARAGCRVIMACRNTDAGEIARSEIIADTNNSDIHVLKLDLASRASIHEFIDGFSRQFGSLNVLINNAGIAKQEFSKTEDGFEINIGTNFFGTYVLTTGLLPFFDELHEKRIINLTSNIYRIGWFKTEHINRYRWFRAYAVSKRMILLYTKWLAEDKELCDFRVNAVHPGIVDTSIMYTGQWYDAVIKVLCKPFFITAEEGARTCVSLALDMAAVNGKYFAKGEQREIRLSRRMIHERDDLLAFCRMLNSG